jgi:2-oxoglutarate dehydrogenase E2 component (dihydrolipoamide succinyltransferase)
MITDVVVPPLPESVQEGVIMTWRKKTGDAVTAGEILLDLETDKIVLEVTAGADGVLTAVLHREGEAVKAGDVLGRIDGAATAGSPPPPPAKLAAAVAPRKPAERPQEPVAVDARVQATAPAAVPGLPPSVRSLLAEHQLNPADITGTGPSGRLTTADVVRYLEHSPKATLKLGDAAPDLVPAAAAAVVPSARQPEQRTPMTPLRARIAQRLVDAQHQAALLTTFNEINMQAVKELRAKYKESFEQQHGVKLGYVSFFIKACLEGLKKFPILNASVDGEDIVHHGYFNIGVAVGTARGLVVPVLRNVDTLSLAQIELAIGDFAKRAETGALRLDDLQGGTFTISNGGVFGSLFSTPIVNPPQSAILGMHRVEDRPVAEKGQVVIRPMMYVALTYDHRIIDGREAVQFLVTVKQSIEDPAKMLLD